MEAIVQEVVKPEDLKKFEQRFNEQCLRGQPSATAQFEYAWCLVRSQSPSDLRKGTLLLQELFHKTADETAKRDYLFYLAVGHTRLKEYEKALKYAKAIQQVEPGNHQAREMTAYIEKKMKKEGLIGMAIVGGAAAVAFGALAGLGVALAKK
ncbi:hypothetical protein CAPTEDRAFT_165888 [Capitella teleta]|uniref:Mitochondrial fission 1 protein n=1 Tax=Capitella teleta TaxID=283909 RepID=R7U731_CAPTE|nr:hypothetical protein CAPTEDRAFT_165888 [Capitella teleta]|eukprot:ELT98945.1 hypothetical protein CAPTEDRAFT_165888 [Capitella teleta]